MSKRSLSKDEYLLSQKLAKKDETKIINTISKSMSLIIQNSENQKFRQTCVAIIQQAKKKKIFQENEFTMAGPSNNWSLEMQIESILKATIPQK